MRSKCHTSNNYLQRIPFLWLFFHLIGDPGSSDGPFPIGVFACLNLFLHASSTETKKQLNIDFQGKDRHILMLRGRDAALNEIIIILKKIKIFGNNFRASKRNLARHKMHLWVLTRKSFQECFIKDFISSADSTAQSKSDSHICRYVYPKDHRYLLFSKVL